MEKTDFNFFHFPIFGYCLNLPSVGTRCSVFNKSTCQRRGRVFLRVFEEVESIYTNDHNDNDQNDGNEKRRGLKMQVTVGGEAGGRGSASYLVNPLYLVHSGSQETKI